MIPRYSRPEMASIWDPQTRFRIWFEIEAHASDAMAELEARTVTAFEALGVLMTNTCINYQTVLPPTRAIAIGGPLTIVFGPLGPIAGGFAGAFAIVVAHELYLRRTLKQALHAGFGTFVGRMAGMILKVVISAAMIISVAAAMLF